MGYTGAVILTTQAVVVDITQLRIRQEVTDPGALAYPAQNNDEGNGMAYSIVRQ